MKSASYRRLQHSRRPSRGARPRVRLYTLWWLRWTRCTGSGCVHWSPTVCALLSHAAPDAPPPLPPAHPDNTCGRKLDLVIELTRTWRVSKTCGRAALPPLTMTSAPTSLL